MGHLLVGRRRGAVLRKERAGRAETAESSRCIGICTVACTCCMHMSCTCTCYMRMLHVCMSCACACACTQHRVGMCALDTLHVRRSCTPHAHRTHRCPHSPRNRMF